MFTNLLKLWLIFTVFFWFLDALFCTGRAVYYKVKRKPLKVLDPARMCVGYGLFVTFWFYAVTTVE